MKMDGIVSFTLHWRSVIGHRDDLVERIVAYIIGQYIDDRLVSPRGPLINEDCSPKIADAPLMLIFGA